MSKQQLFAVEVGQYQERVGEDRPVVGCGRCAQLKFEAETDGASELCPGALLDGDKDVCTWQRFCTRAELDGWLGTHFKAWRQLCEAAAVALDQPR